MFCAVGLGTLRCSHSRRFEGHVNERSGTDVFKGKIREIVDKGEGPNARFQCEVEYEDGDTGLLPGVCCSTQHPLPWVLVFFVSVTVAHVLCLSSVPLRSMNKAENPCVGRIRLCYVAGSHDAFISGELIDRSAYMCATVLLLEIQIEFEGPFGNAAELHVAEVGV